MRSGYIIERYDSMTGAYTCNRLCEEGRRLGMDVSIIGMQDTCAADGRLFNRGGELTHRDFCVIRHRPNVIRDCVCSLADRSYNDAVLFDRYLNKARQIRDIRSDSMRIPAHVLSTSNTDFDALADRLGVPFVAKGLEGSRGDQIHLVTCDGDYERLQHDFGPAKEWLFEEFVSESRGRDLRVYSVRGEPVACMQRSNDRDFRANFALGAVLRPHEITPEIREIASDVYGCTDLDVVGIDLLFGKDSFVFCEANVMPGIRGIEGVTGVNVAGAVMGMIAEDRDGQDRG